MPNVDKRGRNWRRELFCNVALQHHGTTFHRRATTANAHHTLVYPAYGILS